MSPSPHATLEQKDNTNTIEPLEKTRTDELSSVTVATNESNITKKFLISITSITTIALLLLGNVILAFVTGSWDNTPLGALQRSISNAYLSATGKTEKNSNGDTLYVYDDTKVFRTQDGLAYAPEPLHEFRDKTCDMTPLNEVTELSPNTWSAPHIQRAIQDVPTEASFIEAGQNNETIVAPDAPEGIIFEPGAQVGDTEGAILLAGHVDYAPGALSANGGEYSPWAQLHRFDSCDHIYVTNSEGLIEEYVVVSVYTEDQDIVAVDQEYFRNTGQKTLYLVTCSGKSVGNTGGVFQFNYKDNLIVKALPVHTTS